MGVAFIRQAGLPGPQVQDAWCGNGHWTLWDKRSGAGTSNTTKWVEQMGGTFTFWRTRCSSWDLESNEVGGKGGVVRTRLGQVLGPQLQQSGCGRGVV